MKTFRGEILALLSLPCFLSPVSGQMAEATPTASPAVQAESPSAGGRRIREFQGDDLGQVLRLLARQAKISLLVDDAIKGNVDARLENSSAMEAIEALVRQYKLSMVKDDKGVYYLTPRDAADTVLDAIAKPETANRVAAYLHNLYTALIKEGFEPDESMQIVQGIDPGGVITALSKKPDPTPAK